MSWNTSSKLAGTCLVAIAALLAGCGPSGIHDPSDTLPISPNALTLYQFAGRLNLQVVRAGPHGASLRNRANAVTLFAEPAGAVFVNGRRIHTLARPASIGGTLLIPAEAVALIRSALRPEPKPTRADPPKPQTKGRVVLDPGHGGKDVGAIAVTGIYEKHVVLPIAQAVQQRLIARGIEVVMTRADDRFIELDQRARIANRVEADLFVSIHADSARNRAARGHTVYVARSGAGESVTLATRIDRQLTARGIVSRGVRRADYRVLVKTRCPAVLVEVGYLSNRVEAGRLATSSHCNGIAEAIAQAVAGHLAD